MSTARPGATTHTERIVRDRARTKLKLIVADKTLVRKKPDSHGGSLREAAHVEPSLWWSPWSAVLVASSVVGENSSTQP